LAPHLISTPSSTGWVGFIFDISKKSYVNSKTHLKEQVELMVDADIAVLN